MTFLDHLVSDQKENTKADCENCTYNNLKNIDTQMRREVPSIDPSSSNVRFECSLIRIARVSNYL